MRRFFLLLVLGLLSPFIFSAGYSGELIDRIVAVVNEDIITLYELEAASKSLFQIPEEKARDEKALREAKRQVLDNLIEGKLVDQEAKKLGIVVTEREVDEAIGDIIKANNISKEELLKSLEKAGVSMEFYRSQIKDRIEKLRLTNIEVRVKVAITEEELKGYYQKNLAAYQTLLKVRPAIIFLPLPKEASEELNKQVREEALDILNRIRAGQDFAALAREHSRGPNAQNGGDMGLLKSDEMEENFRKATLALRAGQVSDLVNMEGGFLIIKILEREESRTIPFEEIRDKMKQELYDKVVEEKFKDWLKRIKDKAHIDIRLEKEKDGSR